MKTKDVLLMLRGDLSQEQLAEKLNVAPRTIQNWENGKLPKKAIEKYSEAFGVSPDFIRGRSDSLTAKIEGLEKYSDDWIYLRALEMSTKNPHLKFCLTGKYINEDYNDFSSTMHPDDLKAGYHPAISIFLDSVYDLLIKKSSISYKILRFEKNRPHLHECEAINIKLRYDIEPFEVVCRWSLKDFLNMLLTIRATAGTYLNGIMLDHAIK